MPVPITGLYLALFAVLSAAIAFPAGKLRGSTGISVGDGGNLDLTLESEGASFHFDQVRDGVGARGIQ